MPVRISVALLLLVCAPLAAQTIDGVPRAAEVVAMAPATLEELARAGVPQRKVEHRKRPRPARASSAPEGGAIIADLVTVTNGVTAPPATRGFRSSFDPLPNASIAFAPPDVSGAVGPHHVIGVFNNSVAVHDRNGNQLSFLSIVQFWHDPALPDTDLTDPRVMYDAVNDRWAVAMLGGKNLQFNTLFLAFSATGDPSGAWRRFRVTVPTNPNDSLDFTRMAFTADQIVVTANVYSGDAATGVDIITIPKSTAFSDLTAPAVTTTFTTSVFDLTPVSSGDTAVRFLIQLFPGIRQFSFVSGFLSSTNTYLPSADFKPGPGMCAQLGTTKKVECDDPELHYAFVRNGTLWAVHTAGDLGRGVVVIWQITGSTAKTILIEDPARDYGYPSLAVNRFGAALVGYAVFDQSIYPSAAYRYIDPAGVVSDPVVAKNGESWFSFTRWGDYTSTLVDPADDTSFWTLQEYGTPPLGTSHITWGTWWTYVRIVPRVRAVRH